MDQREFNRALSDYLTNKKENHIDKDKLIEKLKKRSLKQREVIEEVPDLKEGKVHIIKKEKTFFDELLDFLKPTKKEKMDEQKTKAETDASGEVQDKEFEQAERELEIKIRNPFIKRMLTFLKKIKESYPKGEKIEEEVEEKVEEEVTRDIQEFEEKEKELEKKEEVIKKKKLEVIWDFISRVNILKKSVQKPEEETENVDSENDLKEIAKITALAIKKLPPDEFHKFKTSDDFKLFREILQKHGIIKAKKDTPPEEEESPKKEKKSEQTAEDVARRIYRQEN